jgi:RimJ/RimL family protein N-acetyltransferase
MSGTWEPIEPPAIVVDDSFELDRWRAGDSDALRQFDLDPQTARFFGWTVAQAAAKPDGHYDGPDREQANLRAWREGTKLSLAIRRRSDRRAVGWVELQPDDGEANVSYMIVAGLRGQGIVPRSLAALLAWSEQQIGLRRARLVCHVENRASRRVAEKSGFVFVRRDGDDYRFELNLGPDRDLAC